MVSANIAKLESAFQVNLIPHSTAECEEMAARLAGAVDADGIPQRLVTQEEQTFIRDELLLCKASFEYWATRWMKITSKQGMVQPLFPLLDSQQFVLGKIAQLELAAHEGARHDGILVIVLKASRQVGVCLDPETRVLTGDLRWVSLDSVRVGDVLVGFDELPPGGKGRGRKMRRTRVEAKAEHIRPVFEITTDNGSVLVATGEHRFLSCKKGATTTIWKAVNKLRVGDPLRFALPPWSAGTPDDYWFGGFVDGEGSLRRRDTRKRIGGPIVVGGCELTTTQTPGAVLDRARQHHATLGVYWRESIDSRLPGITSKLGSKPVHKLHVSCLQDVMTVVGKTRPVRFVNGSWWEGCEMPHVYRGGSWSCVVSIKPAGERRVIDLQTTDKTFIAEGFASHNSTLFEGIGTHRTTTQDNQSALIASDTPDNSGYLFGMQETIVENLPWWLRPTITDHVKNTEIAYDGGSHVWVGSGKSMKGQEGTRGQLGRGRTILFTHLSELATWENPDQLNASLFPAIPENPRSFAGLETTAQGRGVWIHKFWKASRAGRTRFHCIYIPWYVEKSYSRPAPPAWAPATSTLEHAKRIEATSAHWVGSVYVPTRDQLYWYECKRAEYEQDDRLHDFLQEYGSIDDDECFQTGGRSVLSAKTLDRLQQFVRPPRAALEVLPLQGGEALQ